METKDNLARDFLAQEVIAVVGVSDQRETVGTKPGLSASKTSVSQSAVEQCRANGIAVIPGSCPAQFLKPDFGHGMMRGLWKMFGYLNLE